MALLNNRFFAAALVCSAFAASMVAAQSGDGGATVTTGMDGGIQAGCARFNADRA